MNVTDFLPDFHKKGYALNTDSHTIIDLPLPSRVTFPFLRNKRAGLLPLVKRGEPIDYGQALWNTDGRAVFPSPVQGTVQDIVTVPDTRGEKMLPAIVVEPSSEEPESPFPPLDPQSTSPAELRQRVEEAGIVSGSTVHRALLEVICPEEGKSLDGLIVMALDREPAIAANTQLFLERCSDALAAAHLLGVISGTQRLFLALPENKKEVYASMAVGEDIEILWVPPFYPETLDSLMVRRCGLPGEVAVVSVETALAAYDAVYHGLIQNKKVLTVVGPEGEIAGNFRVWIGTSFRELLAHLELTPEERDKVVAGGPMLGFAQYSLDGAVDCGTSALMLIRSSSIIPWSTEPCINCGACIDACPVNLQAQLIGRYSEFGLFDRTLDYSIDDCIECGLCAAACAARRPLLQLIDLAKGQLEKEEERKVIGAEEAREAVEAVDNSALPVGNPALSLFSGLPRFTVGFSPHWRSKASITRMNIAFILALMPMMVVSAFSQFYGKQAVALDASVPSVNAILRVFVLEMGLDTGVLWFSGVLGMALFGMGMGILVEYLCQVFMRQPYYARNGHGALMGLLIVLLMPPSVSIWILLVAIVVALFMAKQVFGGIGGYPLHPALVGWLVVYLSWPHYVYPIGAASIAGFSTAVAVMTVLGGVGLVLTGYIRLEIPLGVLVGTAGFAFIFQDDLGSGVVAQLFSGHVFLAAFFLATDATSSPANRLARWIYGVGIGFLIILIRAFGIWHDAVPFAILLMNIVSPLLDRIKPTVIKQAG